MDDDFYRIRRLPPYVFAEVNAMKAAARARGEDIVDLGMGNPDGAPPKHVIDKLAEVAAKPNAHRYSASRGIPGLQEGPGGLLPAPLRRRRSTPTRKSSSPWAPRKASPTSPRRSPRPATSCSRPTRATRSTASASSSPAPRSARSRPRPATTSSSGSNSAMRYTVPRPKVLVIGYPSNPTAYVADLAFYERLVAFAREHELIVISDLAYAEIYFGDTPTPSILQVEGAKDVAVEFTSMSKTYSMAGWRIGFAVGNARLIEALARVKSYLDYGAFTPVQAAAVRRAQRPAGHRRVQPRALQEAPRRAGRKLRPRRLGRSRCRRPRCSPGRRSRSASAIWARWSSPSAADRGPCRGRARASASARKAKASSASRWSRTSSACARRRAA